ncbi:hypothetical protein BaRGS_00029284 [Batillaria attramentaria]|uniref:Uncharacterized protein n=1 Tax=Batillaria attramentaria TaxID=370345 RepID=A0ABD0JX70_9CAEN
MATSSMTFDKWRQQSNEGLMATAEELLEKLEDVADLLTEIDEKYILIEKEADMDDAKTSMIQRFHEGLDSARNLVNVLKREKWRLSKREMSSSLNQTVDALSMRVIQLESQLVEAQEVQENLEAELQEHRNKLYRENEDLKKTVKALNKSNVQKENSMLKDEVSVLTDENRKLKEMVRDAEAQCSPLVQRREASSASAAAPVAPPRHKRDDNLSKLTKEFLDELSSLELKEKAAGSKKNSNEGATSVSVTRDVNGEYV